MITCTFAGHREIFHKGIDQKLTAELEKLLRLDSEFLFYFGEMGEFDSLCINTVWQLMRDNPEKSIRMVLVMPYMTKQLNFMREYYQSVFHEVIIPGESAEVHFKRAIFTRNRWMVDHSQYLIAYVHRNFGGAFETVKYAMGKNVDVLNLLA